MMEMLRQVISFFAILVSVFNIVCSSTSTIQRSAIISHIASVPNGVSSAKLIECAFHLMRTSGTSFVRIAAGTDVCEQLGRPADMDSSFFVEGYEYLENSVTFNVFDIPVRFINKYL